MKLRPSWLQLVASPYFLLVLTTLFWASNFVLGRAVRDELSPIGLSFWRWTAAGLLILPFTVINVSRQWTIIVAHWRILAGLSLLGVAHFNTFVYIGLQNTTATNALITISTAPVVIIAFSFLLLRIPIRVLQAAGISLSLVGVFVMMSRGDIERLRHLRFNTGDLWIIAAVLSWALYSVCLKWRPPQLSALNFLAVTVWMGVIVLFPVYLYDTMRHSTPMTLPTLTSSGVILSSVLYLAIFPSLLAYIFWNRAVAELGANRTGQFLHLMPVFGTILAVLFLGERLQGFHVIGVLFIAIGIYLATACRD